MMNTCKARQVRSLDLIVRGEVHSAVEIGKMATIQETKIWIVKLQILRLTFVS